MKRLIIAEIIGGKGFLRGGTIFLERFCKKKFLLSNVDDGRMDLLVDKGEHHCPIFVDVMQIRNPNAKALKLTIPHMIHRNKMGGINNTKNQSFPQTCNIFDGTQQTWPEPPHTQGDSPTTSFQRFEPLCEGSMPTNYGMAPDTSAMPSNLLPALDNADLSNLSISVYSMIIFFLNDTMETHPVKLKHSLMMVSTVGTHKPLLWCSNCHSYTQKTFITRGGSLKTHSLLSMELAIPLPSEGKNKYPKCKKKEGNAMSFGQVERRKLDVKIPDKMGLTNFPDQINGAGFSTHINWICNPLMSPPIPQMSERPGDVKPQKPNIGQSLGIQPKNKGLPLQLQPNFKTIINSVIKEKEPILTIFHCFILFNFSCLIYEDINYSMKDLRKHLWEENIQEN
ncbi:hypothetical protein VP01_966g1 [Puccinia sorghi]|uniref:Uncharacterized protein n=1 Tax=Puccinia sorghi TaxID=27349 RepID=A0A0L6U615_9BASI|nr:hypothetical protein VP01_966g1 [Puccinia sorghi]